MISQGAESGEAGHNIRGELGAESTAFRSSTARSCGLESVIGPNDDSNVTELRREPWAVDQLVEELQEGS